MIHKCDEFRLNLFLSPTPKISCKTTFCILLSVLSHMWRWRTPESFTAVTQEMEKI